MSRQKKKRNLFFILEKLWKQSEAEVTKKTKEVIEEKKELTKNEEKEKEAVEVHRRC